MTAQPQARSTSEKWASGGTLFGGVVLTVVGVLDIFQGIAAIAKDDVYTRVGDYVFKFDLTSWGWIHLILGILAVIVGLGLLKGMSWARAAGVAIASLTIIANFMWLPYTPWWALILIAVSVFVIWSLCKDWGHEHG
ncbi:DUF7144 family membrane protein [Streptomyces showdoensis]|uniref:Membrane protein n=1 Tax=Streptomyces showdoensis TaxID=68268 RepID=A0A2P2GGA8_STREW|nr:hypothetical protein [Streptomyces showdoensis]KKZ70556.1 membrane protein [Streptomyces showdoensis]